ncbi:MAG: LPS export ABC transporter permease LptG [Rubellimicrobium sp.]|nr:LPS export ABC transporter permease LptG [Rubellimicrobium sp.]
MILHRYFARRFLASTALVGGGLFALLLLIDIVETARIQSASGAASGLGPAVRKALLGVAPAFYQALPLVMILAAVALFLAMARSSELVVTRAAGRSAIAALMAPLAVAFALGLGALIALNPIVAATERALARQAGGPGSVLSLSEAGLWLRQGGVEGQTVIHADRANGEGTDLSGVSLITFAPDGHPERRIEATRARLADGGWQIERARVWPLDAPNPEAAATTHDRLTLPSTLTAEEIRESLAPPASIALWDLPGFIARMAAAGFSTRRHEVHFQTELALPLLMVAMVMIGAGFTMRHQRGGRTGVMVLAAILVAFAMHFVRNFAQILGEAGQIPAPLAAWAPPLAAVALALGLLLHLEDG